MDPLTATVTTIGLALAVAGSLTLIAWRHERARVRVPALLLTAAIVVLAAPPPLTAATSAIDPTPHGAADAPAEPGEEPVVDPDELERR